MALPHKALVRAAFLTVSIAWGTTYVGMRVAVESFHPLVLAALRFTLAGVVLMVVLWACGLALPSRREWPWLAAVGLLLLTGTNVLVASSLQYLPSVYIALLVNLGPLIYVLLARVTGEHIPRRAWLGLAMGAVGLLLLLAQRLRASAGGLPLHTAHFWPAVGMALLAPVLGACGSLLGARKRLACHPLMMAAAQNVAGGLGAAVLGYAAGYFDPLPHVSARSLWAFVWLVVVGSWLGYVAYLYCVLHLRSASVAVTTYLNTVVSLLCGAVVLGERPTPLMLAGGGVMLLGVIIVQAARGGPRKREALAERRE